MPQKRARRKLVDGCLAITRPRKDTLSNGVIVNIDKGCVAGYIINDDEDAFGHVMGVDFGETVLVLDAEKSIILYDGCMVMIPRACLLPL